MTRSACGPSEVADIARNGQHLQPAFQSSVFRLHLMLTLCLYLTGAASAQGVGVETIEVYSSAERQFSAAVFYPTDRPFSVTRIGDYDVAAVPDAEPKADSFPLVVISPGALGNTLSHHDTASYLARSGFIVVAVEHTRGPYGNETDIGDLGTAYERARQVSAVLDYLLAGAQAGRVDHDQIGIIGVSAGTVTALILAGSTSRGAMGEVQAVSSLRSSGTAS